MKKGNFLNLAKTVSMILRGTLVPWNGSESILEMIYIDTERKKGVFQVIKKIQKEFLDLADVLMSKLQIFF